MKNFTPLIIAALFISALVGCSKHSPRPKVTSLGVVEVSNGIPIHQDLGGGKACVITPTILQDGSVSLAITMLTTNSIGVVTTLPLPKVQSISGQQVEVRVGDIADLRLTPQIKP